MNIDESHTAKGYTPADQAPGRTIEELFIHHWGSFGQTHDGVVNFFENGPGATSAHFVVSDGRVTCLVSPADVAWHAGVWASNLKSVGIECRPEATAGDYRQVAELVAWLRSQYGNLPLKPHRSVYNTACPGNWDLGRIDALARSINTPAAPAPVVTQAASVVTESAPVADGGLYWVVEAGDTLSKVADYYGITVDVIAAANGIGNPNAIRVGQKLSIPGPLVWIVDPGDTLAGIASHYGVDVSVVAANNGIADPNTIYPGQVITIL